MFLGGVILRLILPEINASVMKRLKFMMGGVAVFFAVLLPGTLWYKGAQRSVTSAAAGEATLALQNRLNLVAHSVGSSVDLVGPLLWLKAGKPGHKAPAPQLRRDLPYDVVAVFTNERKFYDGFRTMTDGQGVVDLSAEASKLLFAADSGLMDRVAARRPIAGVLTVEDKPLLASVHHITLEGQNAVPGFIIVGKWLSAEDFVVSRDQVAMHGVNFYSLGNDAAIPTRIQSVIPAAQRNGGFLYELEGAGGGVLYSVLNDINGRPSLLTALPWQAPWRATGTLGFGIFFSTAAITGLGTWALLVWGDASNRRRVRKFDGLSSLSMEHIKVLVEAFPGYAFAIKPNMEYVAVSRILAGITGHEPSYFCGQVFGSIAAETCTGSYEKLFRDLRDPKRWPRVADVDHKAEGLGNSFELTGAAHFLAKQDVLFVILSSEVKSMTRTQNKSNKTSKSIRQSTVA